MKYKKSIIIVMLAVFLFSVASVCASDVNDTQADSEDVNQMELSPNIEIAGDNLQATEENATLELSNDGEMLSEGDVGTFSDLSSKISGYEVKLDNDYECEDGFFSSGIQIWESHIIDG